MTDNPEKAFVRTARPRYARGLYAHHPSSVIVSVEGKQPLARLDLVRRALHHVVATTRSHALVPETEIGEGTPYPRLADAVCQMAELQQRLGRRHSTPRLTTL